MEHLTLTVWVEHWIISSQLPLLIQQQWLNKTKTAQSKVISLAVLRSCNSLVFVLFRTPKEKLMVALRKGEAERVVAMIDQFPGELEPNMSADTAQNKLIHRAAR